MLGLLLVVVCPLLFFAPRLPRIERGARLYARLSDTAFRQVLLGLLTLLGIALLISAIAQLLHPS